MDQIFRYFLIFCIFLVPSNLELGLHISNCNGNIDVNEIFLGLYYKRNFIYFSLGLSILGYLFGYKFIWIFGIFMSGFFGFKMFKDIYIYRHLDFFKLDVN